MNSFLNYLVEANLGLCILLVAYYLFLSKETDFAVKRIFLLLSIGVSIVFPLFHFDQSSQLVPSLKNILPPTWLPEVVVYAEGNPAIKTNHINFDTWIIIDYAYTAGVLIGLSIFIVRIYVLLKTLWSVHARKFEQYIIFESEENRSSFSFFRCIYIGQSSQLSPEEKALIIHHERIHAERLHSFDVLLMHIVGIFFWFNPVIKIYKKIFVQLHEFEADARAVNNNEVDNYCSLLAKVALLSADFKLANHFSNSLTVKRIEMIRTLKAKIKRWKVVALASVLACLFFVVACQDQVISDITDIARNSNNALLAPDVVQQRFEEVKKANPNSTYILVELNEAAEKKLVEMEQKHGIPASIELFTPDNSKYKHSTLNTGPDKIILNQSSEWEKEVKENKDLHTFAIVEYNAMTAQVADNAKGEDEIFTIVEQAAEYPGGLDALKAFLQSNLSYPAIARMKGVEGAVYVSFVVEKDGSISNAKVVKGISDECDAESKRVVSIFPKWKPGKQNHEVVRSMFVIPIKFALNNSSLPNSNSNLNVEQVKGQMQVLYTVKEREGKRYLSGTISSEGQPVKGANVLLVGTTRGSATGAGGTFELEIQDGTKSIAVSHIGFASQEIDFSSLVNK